MSDQIAENVGRLGVERLRPLHFGGHCFYVRKCLRGQQVGKDPIKDRFEGLIALPEQVADWSIWVEVLAKGPMVGKKCSKGHAKKFNRPRWLVDDVSIGDQLMCPNDDVGIKRSPYCKEEYFIEEYTPFTGYDD